MGKEPDTLWKRMSLDSTLRLNKKAGQVLFLLGAGAKRESGSTTLPEAFEKDFFFKRHHETLLRDPHVHVARITSARS